ncbi:hypothetical protein LTR66_005448 [Elasticomyces elasticus]|nr:hypothetical protein LTR66_005448 [Elasticomyces elasticus]
MSLTWTALPALAYQDMRTDYCWSLLSTDPLLDCTSGALGNVSLVQHFESKPGEFDGSSAPPSAALCRQASIIRHAHFLDGLVDETSLSKSSRSNVAARVLALNNAKPPDQSYLSSAIKPPSRACSPTISRERLRPFVRESSDAEHSNLVHQPPRPPALSPVRIKPFVRRDSRAASAGVQSPASCTRSPLADFSLYIHSPQPQRFVQSLPSDEDQKPLLDTSCGNYDPSTRLAYDRRTTQASAPCRTTHPYQHRGFPSGFPSVPFSQPTTCLRHGRKLATKPKARGATLEGTERSISGAYIPTGFKIRSQVEATSPWAIPAKSLTKKEGTTLSPNICPDCLVEQAIKRRETMIISEEASARGEKGDLRLGDRLSHDDFGSTTTEPGTPTDDHHPSTLIGLGMELQEVHIPGAAVTGFPPDEVGTIIAADLGDMLDAIIIEHRGTLDSVITNLRDGAPGLEDIQRLSKELAEISRAVAEVPIERFTEASMGQSSHPVAAGMKRRRSVIVDAPPAQIRKRVKSIPDLLQLIDSAADNLGLDVGQTNGSAVGTVRNGRVHLAGRRKSTSDEHSLLHGQKSDDQDPLLSTIPISNQRPTAPRSPSRLPNYVLAQDVGTESRFPHHSGEDGLLHKPGEIHVRHSTPSPPTPVSMYRTAWPSPLLLAKTDTTRLSPLLSDHVAYRKKHSSFASSGHADCSRRNNARERASSPISHTDRIAREYERDAHFQPDVNELDTTCSASSNRKGTCQAKPGRTAGESRSSCGEDEESRDKGIRDQAREGREMDEKGEGWIWS